MNLAVEELRELEEKMGVTHKEKILPKIFFKGNKERNRIKLNRRMKNEFS